MKRWGGLVVAGVGLLLVAWLLGAGGAAIGLAQEDGLVYLPMVTGGPVGPAGCSTCSADVYNCDDFSTQAAAQACFDFCMEQVGSDIHRLDSDNNGVACEALPLVFGGWVFQWR